MSIRSKVLLGIAGLSLLLIAAMPAPDGYVNDFANIIPDDREAVLEQRLQSYEAQTTIEIAIVTTPSLDGEPISDWSVNLGREWGVGKKSSDNGLLVVVAPNERDYWIAVGYGLEADMTDARASVLGSEHLPDAFRAGDYAGGIENLTTGILNTLGGLSPEDRARNRAARERDEAYRAEAESRAFWNFMTWVFWALVAVGILVFAYVMLRKLARRIERAQARKAKRRVLTKSFEESAQSLVVLKEQFDLLVEPALPSWMAGDYERDRLQFTVACDDALEIAELIPDALNGDDLEEAERVVTKHGGYVQVAYASYHSLSTTPDKVKRFRHDTEDEAEAAHRAVAALKRDVNRFGRRGYRLAILTPDLDLGKLLAASTALVGALTRRTEGVNDTSDKVRADAKSLFEEANGYSTTLKRLVELRNKTEERLEVAQRGLKNLPGLFDGHRQLLVRFKKTAPATVYSAFKDVDSIETTASEVRELIVQAKAKNSWEQQQYDQAAALVDQVEQLLERVQQFCASASEVEQQFDRAKKGAFALQEVAERAIERASEKTEDSDVGQSAKRDLAAARTKLTKATTLSSGGRLVDWRNVAALLIEAKDLADKAHQSAQNDIDEAEEDRRRQRRQEEERSQRSFSSSSSGYSSSSSSSSSGVSFGGGSFGGGGAGGKW